MIDLLNIENIKFAVGVVLATLVLLGLIMLCTVVLTWCHNYVILNSLSELCVYEVRNED